VENEPILHSRSGGKGMGLGGERVGWGQSLCVGILRGDDRETVRCRGRVIRTDRQQGRKGGLRTVR
jgi:hypothetical protein